MKLLKAISVFLTLGLMACGAASQANGGSPQEAYANTSDITAVGTVVGVRNNRTVLVERSKEVIKLQADNGFTPPIENRGGKLLLVHLTLGNTSSTSGDMLGTQLQLMDSQGRQYNDISSSEDGESLSIWLEEQGLEDFSAQILPGETIQTAKVFRVARDADELKLLVDDQAFAIE